MRSLRPGRVALALLVLAAAALPASAATCTRWQMFRQSFFIEQSDGFSVQVTPGSPMSEGEGFIKFGTNGSLIYERKTGIFNQNRESSNGRFVEGIHLHKTHPGYVTFRVYWDSGLGGQYHGNIHNPRFHDGTLIADLKGWISSSAGGGYHPEWTSRNTPVFCRAADVVPDVDPNVVPPIVLTMPPPAPPPPPPRPKRVIDSGGKAGIADRDPNAPKRIGQFDLPFESESSLGGKFDVKFEVYSAISGSPTLFKVRGTITNTDIGPEYNGTFDGTMPANDTRTVTLTYLQPAANARGTVVFRFSEDGETFTGSGTHQGHTPFQWTGRRKR